MPTIIFSVFRQKLESAIVYALSVCLSMNMIACIPGYGWIGRQEMGKGGIKEVLIILSFFFNGNSGDWQLVSSAAYIKK